MTRDEALAKVISVRHHCFARGILGRGADRDSGGDEDFRQAFRTVNRAYVEVRYGIASNALRDTQKRPATRRREAA